MDLSFFFDSCSKCPAKKNRLKFDFTQISKFHVFFWPSELNTFILLFLVFVSNFLTKKMQLSDLEENLTAGGGSAGCNALYHLSKQGTNAILLERSKLTSGTTWHTGGLFWRLRPNDVDIQLLDSTRRLLLNLEEETGVNPGWIQNGGLFIAHSDVSEHSRKIFPLTTAMGKGNNFFDVQRVVIYPRIFRYFSTRSRAFLKNEEKNCSLAKKVE